MRDELKVRLTPERLIRGAHNVVRRNPSWRGQPLWSLVSELTGYGSTYSIEVCRGIGFDPTHKIGGTLECTAPETGTAPPNHTWWESLGKYVENLPCGHSDRSLCGESCSTQNRGTGL